MRSGSTTRRPAVLRLLRPLVALLSGVLVLTGCSVYDIPLPGGTSAGPNPIVVRAMFRDVMDLVPQSTVKVNDVSVGKITAVSLHGYVAEVTMKISNKVDLPDNAIATIRQTSLLGEKFVSLSPPPTGASGNRLKSGDVIGLQSTGRNPEIEEVLGALSLLLNGGGVGQLKLITEELNNALTGHEGDARLLLEQLRVFTGQLDNNKQSIITAIDNLNRLAVQLNQQDPAIKSALDNLPSALRSVDSQRAALVRMLQALQGLSGVGVHVIQASKASTIDSLRSLSPVLYKLAQAGSNLPNALQVFLTYPFVDSVVGKTPITARNLHMGDYVNLSIRLDLQLPKGGPSLPPVPPIVVANCQQAKQVVRQAINRQAAAAARQAVNAVPALPKATKDQLYKQVYTQLVQYLTNQLLNAVDCKNPANTINKIPGLISNVLNHILQKTLTQLLKQLTSGQLTQQLCSSGILPPSVQKQCAQSFPGLPVPTPTLPSLPGLPLGRAPFGATTTPKVDLGGVDPLNGPVGDSAKLGYNSTLAALLLQGVAQ